MSERLETNGLYGNYEAFGPYRVKHSSDNGYKWVVTLRNPNTGVTSSIPYKDFLVEQHLKRRLLPAESVVHTDNNPSNVALLNLAIITKKTLRAGFDVQELVPYTHKPEGLEEVKCCVCGKPFLRRKYANRINSKPTHTACRPKLLQMSRAKHRVERKDAAFTTETTTITLKALLYKAKLKPSQTLPNALSYTAKDAFESAYIQWQKEISDSKLPEKIYAYVEFSVPAGTTDKVITQIARKALLADNGAKPVYPNGFLPTEIQMCVHKSNFRESDFEQPRNILLTGGPNRLALRIWW